MADPRAHDTSTPPAQLEQAALMTLAPEYDKSQHRRYVEHIVRGIVNEPKNRNIALTGPYGSGKSSVLDQVVKVLEKTEADDESLRELVPAPLKIVRLSISTLGPELGEQDTTNRIEKELVKQLLHQAQPGEVLRSRFARRPDVSKRRRRGEAVGLGVALSALLWMFGVRPSLGLPGPGWLWSIAALLLLAAIIGLGFHIVRGHLSSRIVSQVAAAGASISFDERTDSVFDKFLDEIVAFFEAQKTDIVIFEDLDRFEDPEIFDSLRSLNSLINDSANRRELGRTLHFVYAIKDSLFRKIATPASGGRKDEKNDEQRTRGENGPVRHDVRADAGRDAARDEVDRANRTKFFELVVPIVPFLSASNARDLLDDELKTVELPGDVEVSRALLDLVARHTTDMRLLRNIRNEFVVFAQRLLLAEHPAPGITADDVFALVVYKNFHMSDYEQIFHRTSRLDELERIRGKIVERSIRELREAPGIDARQRELAKTLGKRLEVWLHSAEISIIRSTLQVGDLNIGEQLDQVQTWRVVSDGKELAFQVNSQYSRVITQNLDSDTLRVIFPEAFTPRQWIEIDGDIILRERRELEREITRLRGADFQFLHSRTDFRYDDKSFANYASIHLESDLARELVAKGYLGRYFAEYVSVFYGKFTGVAVANFFRNCIGPNEMQLQFQLSGEDADNVIELAPGDAPGSRSTLNISLMNRLLRRGEQEPGNESVMTWIRQIIGFATNEGTPEDEGNAFIVAMLQDASAERELFVARLVEREWGHALEYVADPAIIAEDDARTQLLDVALQAGATTEYLMTPGVEDTIASGHLAMTSFTSGKEPERIYEFAKAVQLETPELEGIGEELRARFISDGAYALTAGNLRSAAGIGKIESLTLDAIAARQDAWKRCTRSLASFREYLDVVAQDSSSTIAVYDPDILLRAITALSALDDDEPGTRETLLYRLLETSAPQAKLEDITETDAWTWEPILHANKMLLTVRNLLEVIGDETTMSPGLHAMLGHGEEIEMSPEPDEADREQARLLALRLLNLTEPGDVFHLAAPEDRERWIGFARRVASDAGLGENLGLFRTDVPALLHDLLDAGLLEDSREAFAHFLQGGWDSIASAIPVSESFRDFLDPELIENHVHELLDDEDVAEDVKRIVLGELDGYVPEDAEHAAATQASLRARAPGGDDDEVLATSGTARAHRPRRRRYRTRAGTAGG